MVPSTFILLDGASMRDCLSEAMNLNDQNKSLLSAKGEEYLHKVAPYIFTFENNNEFETWFQEKGWGNSWGIIVNSNSSLNKLLEHFRRFLIVQSDEGRLYFRFYDPRVLRVVLPMSDTNELTDFFKSINFFVMEDEDPEYTLCFRYINYKLEINRTTKKEFWEHGTLTTDKNTNELSTNENSDDVKPPEEESDTGWSYIIE